NRFQARFRVASRTRNVIGGTILVGDEEQTRHRVSLKYLMPESGSLSISWHGKIRRNEDIGSQVDYNTFSSHLSFKRSRLGTVRGQVSYYLGKYENRSDSVDYEFADWVVSGTVYPRKFGNIAISVGGSYYLSRRDVDVDKTSLHVSVITTFRKDYSVEARYDLYNFDDYLTSGAFYTSNIFKVEISRKLKL
ncbi:MAG: hypothetical protein V3T31_08675, partial [candidate division Zixibacteria bacterium]